MGTRMLFQQRDVSANVHMLESILYLSLSENIKLGKTIEEASLKARGKSLIFFRTPSSKSQKSHIKNHKNHKITYKNHKNHKITEKSQEKS